MRHVVTSRDGIEFEVDSYPNTITYDRTFAERFTAEELEKHPDFVRVYPAHASRPDPEDFTDAPRPEDETPIEQIASRTVIGGDEPVREVEALDRAAYLWGTAGYVVGDKP